MSSSDINSEYKKVLRRKWAPFLIVAAIYPTLGLSSAIFSTDKYTPYFMFPIAILFLWSGYRLNTARCPWCHGGFYLHNSSIGESFWMFRKRCAACGMPK